MIMVIPLCEIGNSNDDSHNENNNNCHQWKIKILFLNFRYNELLPILARLTELEKEQEEEEERRESKGDKGKDSGAGKRR